MKKFRFKKICCASAALLIAVGINTVSAENLKNIQSYTDKNQVIVYLPASEGNAESVSAQIGNDAVVDGEIKKISKIKSAYIDTTILFDNSLSITAQNRDKMKNVVKGIINNHAKGERITLATFDTEIHELSKESTNYEELIAQVDSIEFVNQDTYLKNALYESFNVETSSGCAFKRFIVLSDGSDDNEVGYTYSELSELLKDKSYQIYSIGSKYEKEIQALEEMFSISRAGNTPYFLLDEIENTDDIVKQIKKGEPKKAAIIEIPEEAMDGSEKTIKLSLDKGDSIIASAEMPFSDLKEKKEKEEAEKAAAEAAEKEAAEKAAAEAAEKEAAEKAAAEAAEKEAAEKAAAERQKMFRLLIIAGTAGAALIILLIIWLASKKRKEKEDAKKEERTDNEEDEETIYGDAQSNDEDDDEETEDVTMLMPKKTSSTGVSERNTAKVYVISLSEEGGKGKVMRCRCADKIFIGRKAECDMAIPDDKSVSGKHCIIFINEDKKIAIRDNASSNGTYLNDDLVEKDVLLETGDTLEIGKSRYTVHIAEE